MRTVKFRGKRVDNGEWFYGYVYKIESKDLWFMDNGKTVSHQVIMETLGQFTGLYDKNGKEIYEWDILNMLESAFNNKHMIVKFDEEYGYYYPFGNGNYSEYPYEVEVIGNIHDNKELI